MDGFQFWLSIQISSRGAVISSSTSVSALTNLYPRCNPLPDLSRTGVIGNIFEQEQKQRATGQHNRAHILDRDEGRRSRWKCKWLQHSSRNRVPRLLCRTIIQTPRIRGPEKRHDKRSCSHQREILTVAMNSWLLLQFLVSEVKFSKSLGY